jgi:nucleotide-binding universal stress UspA family protein
MQVGVLTMNRVDPGPGIRVIFHPSDFSEASEVAFAHALKIALVTNATLNVLHVADKASADWSDFPGVRDTLERWHLIPERSPKSAVRQLGIDVVKVIASSNNPVKASLGFLKEHRADLIVLAVHQRAGRMHWLEKRVGEPIARGAGEMALYIPHGVEGFVSRKDGSVSLRKILIPVANKPGAQPAVDAVARLIRNLQLAAGTVTLLHVGSASEAPSLDIPNDTEWTWSRVAKEGEPAEVILQTANAVAAELIVMTTEGPHGFLDGLRGSTSEQVLRKVRCPVANLP